MSTNTITWCQCSPAFTGSMCESALDTDPCLDLLCDNNGTCVRTEEAHTSGLTGNESHVGAVCACLDSFSGTFCEIVSNATEPLINIDCNVTSDEELPCILRSWDRSFNVSDLKRVSLENGTGDEMVTSRQVDVYALDPQGN